MYARVEQDSGRCVSRNDELVRIKKNYMAIQINMLGSNDANIIYQHVKDISIIIPETNTNPTCDYYIDQNNLEPENSCFKFRELGSKEPIYTKLPTYPADIEDRYRQYD